MSGPVSDHYTNAGLLARLEQAIGEIGKSPDTVTAGDLAPVEEFHIGGRMATSKLLPALGLDETMSVLDIGCGTGGTARHAAAEYGCTVHGVDLTQGFIEAGRAITAWLTLTSNVQLHLRSALDTGFEDGAFDAAYMFHVGMNIEEKQSLACEVARVLKPGAPFLVYDIMRGDDRTTPLTFPVPWASEAAISYVAPPETYTDALETAGFSIVRQEARHDIARPFFDRMAAGAGKPAPALSIATLMGEQAREKSQNLMANYRQGRVVPVEILARKA